MTMHAPKTGWLKIMMLGAIVSVAGCQSTEPDKDDFYEPVAHYERHPIIVTKSGAHAKDCGYWPEDMTQTARNEAYANFGCSQQNNIAAMVANPRDLERPRRQAPADATRRSKIFDNYRQGEATAAEQEAQQKVKISDVGGGSE